MRRHEPRMVHLASFSFSSASGRVITWPLIEHMIQLWLFMSAEVSSVLLDVNF